MKTILTLSATLFLETLLIQGCAKRAEEGVVFIEDGKLRVTEAYTRNAVLLSSKIMELSGKPIAEPKFKSWANSMAFRSIPSLLGSKLIEEEMDARGIKATPESDKKILAAHSKRMRARGASKEELAEKFGDLKDFYLKQFDFESRKAVFLQQLEDEIVLEDAVVDAVYKHNAEKRAEEDGLYKAAFAKAAQAEAKLKEGVNWEDVAKEFNEDGLLVEEYKDNWKEWESIPKTGPYIPENVGVAVRQLKEGEWTEPLETDDGLLIVKVLKIDDLNIDCARINFRLPFFTETPEKPELKEQLKKEMLQEKLEDLIRELHEKHTFTYPMGTNITYEIFK